MSIKTSQTPPAAKSTSSPSICVLSMFQTVIFLQSFLAKYAASVSILAYPLMIQTYLPEITFI